MNATAPGAVWSYFRACHEARELLTPDPELLDLAVTIAGVTKRLADLTAADLRALAVAERHSAAVDALARLDALGGGS